MTISRVSLAQTYEQHDAIIEAAQSAKRDATNDYREHLDAKGWDKDNIKTEVEAFKLAYRRKVAVTKKGVETVEHKDAIADEIYLEITASRAPRAMREENIEKFDPETGEINQPETANEMDRSGNGSKPNSVLSGKRPEGDALTGAGAVSHAGAGESPAAQITEGLQEALAVAKGDAEPYRVVSKPRRPHCRNPEMCAGYGATHCWSCSHRAELGDSAA